MPAKHILNSFIFFTSTITIIVQTDASSHLDSCNLNAPLVLPVHALSRAQVIFQKCKSNHAIFCSNSPMVSYALRIKCRLLNMAFETLWNRAFICPSDLTSCHTVLEDATKIPVFTFPKHAALAGLQPFTLPSLLLPSICTSHYLTFSWNITSSETSSHVS